MSEAIIVALITGGLSLLGIIYSSNKTAQAILRHRGYLPILLLQYQHL